MKGLTGDTEIRKQPVDDARELHGDDSWIAIVYVLAENGFPMITGLAGGETELKFLIS